MGNSILQESGPLIRCLIPYLMNLEGIADSNRSHKYLVWGHCWAPHLLVGMWEMLWSAKYTYDFHIPIWKMWHCMGSFINHMDNAGGGRGGSPNIHIYLLKWSTKTGQRCSKNVYVLLLTHISEIRDSKFSFKSHLNSEVKLKVVLFKVRSWNQ